MGTKLQVWWEKIRQQKVAMIVSAVALLVIIALIIVGYHIDGTGFSGGNSVTTSTTTGGTAPPTITKTVAPQPGKTLWDWLQLLIIPAVLAVGGFWLNQIQTRREDRVASQRAQNDREIALDNQREAKLQEYIDKISELVFSHSLLQSKEGDPARIIARARTLSVVRELDPVRKGSLIRFLYESLLILTEHILTDSTITFYDRGELKVPAGIVRLNDADLSGIDLSGASLMGINLERANLSNANLSGAFLWEVNLEGANLSGANLSDAALTTPGLFQVPQNEQNSSVLSSADLSGANLTRTNLNHVEMSLVTLNNADLSGADLTGATGITNEELEKQALSLKGTTMPDGSIHR